MPDIIARVALYARVSTRMQDAEPQLVRLREWAARQGFEVYMERTDLASGRLVRRSGADEILREARGHHVHVVAVAKVDRWARSLQHLAASVEELHSLGVDFYAVDQGLAVRQRDPTAMLILSILGACAQWEASIISERTKDGLRDKIGKGRHRNGCGVEFKCPTGKHPKKGIAKAPRERASA